MKYRLLNYIACPYCKDPSFPLKLVVFEVRKYDERKLPEDMPRPLCDLYCGYLGKKIEELKKEGREPPCDECIKYEVVAGILICSICNRWYPIIDEIPRILPDEYRNREEDLKFLKQYADKVPEEIKLHGKPFNLSTT